MPAPRAPTYSSKIPGAPKGLPAIEETIFAGVPVNVTLLFSREQYLSAAEAYLRGIERRIAAGLKPDVRTHAALTPSQARHSHTALMPSQQSSRSSFNGDAVQAAPPP